MSDSMQAVALAQVLDRWVEDPSFRSAMRADVSGALSQAGIGSDDDTIGQLAALDWSQSDQALEELIEKKRVYAC